MAKDDEPKGSGLGLLTILAVGLPALILGFLGWLYTK